LIRPGLSQSTSSREGDSELGPSVKQNISDRIREIHRTDP
jgi:hypothetical protein